MLVIWAPGTKSCWEPHCLDVQKPDKSEKIDQFFLQALKFDLDPTDGWLQWRRGLQRVGEPVQQHAIVAVQWQVTSRRGR